MCERKLQLLALTALSLAAFVEPALARDVDWKRFPSFHYFDVDKRIGVESEPTARVVKKAKVESTGAEDGIVVVDQPLRDFLIMAGRRFDIRITVSPKVKGDIQNLSLPGDIDGILDTLAAQFQFDWYRENDSIRVTSSKESVSRVIYLGRMSYEEVVQAIKDAGIKTDSFELTHIESSNSISLNGPAELIAKIELITDAYNKRNSGVRLIRRGRES